MIRRLGRRLLAAAALAALARAAAASAPLGAAREPRAPAEYAAAIQATVAGCTVHAVLGPSRTPLPLETSNFLLDHPDMAAFIVNRRGIAPYRIEMLGPRRSLADDGAGTRGVVNLVERTDLRRVYYGEGVHQSRLFPDIRATAVIVMDLGEGACAGSRACTVTTFHVWVRLKSRFVAGLVKGLRPFLQGTVVGKFSKAFLVADSVGRLMAREPGGVAADVRAFPGLSVEDRSSILAMIARLQPPPAAAAAAPNRQ